MSNQWTSSLVGCLSDIPSCCCVMFCTPCAYGQIVSIARTGSTTGACGDPQACCLLFLVPCAGLCCTHSTRWEIRKQYNIKEGAHGDLAEHFWCFCCSLCQEYRELKVQTKLAAPTPEEMSR
eukprot:c4432_g1_i1.p1 GENE.c4432_g1_i1~~c4432_g1_i1.p1  ORF type:complete len:122 (+),score=9.99 c4432_g1_i1:32-397(+)